MPDPAPVFDVVGVGEVSVDDVLIVDAPPAWGGKGPVRARLRLGGGQVATALFAAQRLGLRTALCAATSTDEAARLALSELIAAGVSVRGVIRRDGVTRSAVVIVDGRGERTVLHHDDPWLALLPEDVASSSELIAASRVLHVDGSFPAASIAAARIAREAGVRVSCDLERPGGALDELLPLVDVCIVSEGFVAPGDLAALAARTASGTAVITLGARGSIAWDGRMIEVRAYDAGKVVDTTACGDTFRGAFLAAHLDGRDLEGCLHFASAAAALKTRDIGRRGCPARHEVEELLRKGSAS